MSDTPSGPRTRAGLIDANRKLIQALGRYGKAGSIMLAGKTWSIQDLQQLFSDENELALATDKAHASWRKQVDKLASTSKANHKVRMDLQLAIRASYGEDPEVLTHFGYALRRPRSKLTPADQLAAGARAKATRQLRGTVGRKKRRQIKSGLDGLSPGDVLARTGIPTRRR